MSYACFVPAAVDLACVSHYDIYQVELGCICSSHAVVLPELSPNVWQKGAFARHTSLRSIAGQWVDGWVGGYE